MAEKRSRTANLTSADKTILANLVRKYTDTFQNKKADVWYKIMSEFNLTSTTMRSMRQLKKAYSYLKAKPKKYVAGEKDEQYNIGEGSDDQLQDEYTMKKILSVLGNNTQSLRNTFDSDAGYSNTVDLDIEEPKQVEQETGSLMLEVDVSMESTSTEEAASCSPFSREIDLEGSMITETEHPGLKSYRYEGKTWVNRRRPNLPQAAIETQSADMMNRLCDLAREKALFYKGRLELERTESEKRMIMAEEEHKIKMKFLEMEAEFVREKLNIK